MRNRDFPGGPVVETSPSNIGGAVSIPGQVAKISHPSQRQNQNINSRSNIVTDSIKTLKMVRIKKKKTLKKRKKVFCLFLKKRTEGTAFFSDSHSIAYQVGA